MLNLNTEKVVIISTLSSLAAPDVVIVTIYHRTTDDDKVGIMITPRCQWNYSVISLRPGSYHDANFIIIAGTEGGIIQLGSRMIIICNEMENYNCK